MLFLIFQGTPWCVVGSTSVICVALAPRGPRCSHCPLLQSCCGAVCLIWGAGAPGRTLVGLGSSSHVYPIESGGWKLGNDRKVQHNCGAGGVFPWMGPLHLFCCSCKKSAEVSAALFLQIFVWTFHDFVLCSLFLVGVHRDPGAMLCCLLHSFPGFQRGSEE